jgi:hypothetical protein
MRLLPAGLVFSMVLSMLLLTSQVRAAIWQNLAQLQLLRGYNVQSAALSMQALSLVPENTHIRWRTGEALVQSGDYGTAANILLPLTGQKIDPLVADLIFETLFNAKRTEEAMQIYESWTPSPSLHSRVAALFAIRYSQQSTRFSLAKESLLLSQALEFNSRSLESKMLEEQLANPDFWSTEVGQRIFEALVWRSQNKSYITKEGSTVDRLSPWRVATLLNLPPSDVKLGQELVETGSFEHISLSLLNWWPMFWNGGKRCNRGLFVIGTDCRQSLSGGCSLRIDGFLTEQLARLEPTRAGVWSSRILMEGKKPYVISFMYRTKRTDSRIASVVLLGSDSHVLFDHRFSPTQGQWKHVMLVIWNPSDKEVYMNALLRSLGEGSIWFDGFSVRQVLFDSQISMFPRRTLMQIDSLTD